MSKAPLRLLRFPGLLVATVSATAILGVASAASPLFVSSAGNRSVSAGLASFCPWTAGLQVITLARLSGQSDFPPGSAEEIFHQKDEALRRFVAGDTRLGPLAVTVVGSTLAIARSGTGPSRNVRLIARTGAFEHIRKLSSAGGEGVWLPDTIANGLRVQAGAHVLLQLSGRGVPVRVAGIYQDLSAGTLPRFWCSQSNLLFSLNALSNSTPPPLVLADQNFMFGLERQLNDITGSFSWEFPVRAEGLTLADASMLSAEVQRVDSRVHNFGSGGVLLFGVRPVVSSEIPAVVAQANGIVAGLGGPVETVAIAGTVVALLVIGAVGVYWVDRRRVEVDILAAKGVSPVTIGARACLEAVLPMAVSATAGLGLAVWLVKRFGPTSLLSPNAVPTAARNVAAAAGIGLLMAGIVVALSARRRSEGGTLRGPAATARAPWEAAVLLLAAASLYEILTRGTAPVEGPNATPRVDVLLLLFPLLFIAGTAGLATRGLLRLLPLLRSWGSRWPPASYLASRRLAGASRIALALIMGGAVSIGVLAYAGTLTSSVRATSSAKARVFTGADVAVGLSRDVPVPDALRGRATEVTKVDLAVVEPGQVAVAVLGVDPSTFSRGAYWDRSFGGASLQNLLTLIRPSPEPGPLPAVVAGDGVPGSATLSFVSGAGQGFGVKVVARVEAFPGMSAGQPMLVVNRDDLAARSRGVGAQQLWAGGSAEEVVSALRAAGAPIQEVATAEGVQGTLGFQSASWAFGFLQALGVLTGLIALASILLYLEARQRSREVAYALSRRMGLRPGSYRWSVMMELTGMLVASFVAGSTLALIAARLVFAKLDPIPNVPPSPLFRVPVVLLAGTAAVLVAASGVGAWWVQRTADRTNVAEVMRVAG